MRQVAKLFCELRRCRWYLLALTSIVASLACPPASILAGENTEQVVARDKSGKVTVSVITSEDGKVAIKVAGTPDRVASIPADQAVLGDEGLKGKWLVLGCELRSIDSIASIVPAIEAVNATKQNIMVGVVAFRDVRPDLAMIPPEDRHIVSHTTPLWLFIKNGKPVYFHRGRLKSTKLTELLGRVFSES